MNRRYMLLGAIIIIVGILLIVGPAAAKTVWSICDETANPGCADDAESQGFWNFAYDDAAPYTTAGLYCCWWERWYKWQKFSTWKGDTAANTMNLGSSESVVDTKSFTPETATAASPTLSQIQPEDGYCPSCCSICDDDTAMALQARSDAIMAKKPWLTEGKNKGTTQSASASTTKTPVASVTAVPTVAQMTFSDAV